MNIEVKQLLEHDWDDRYEARVQLSTVGGCWISCIGPDKAGVVARAMDVAEKCDVALSPFPTDAVATEPLPLAEVASEQEDIVRLLRKAIKQERWLELEYTDGQGNFTVREVFPLHRRGFNRFMGRDLKYAQDQLFVARQKDGSLRTFRVERIQRVTLT